MTKPGLIAFRVEVVGSTTEEVEDELSWFISAMLDKNDGHRSLERSSEFIGPALDEHGEPYVYGRANYRTKGSPNG